MMVFTPAPHLGLEGKQMMHFIRGLWIRRDLHNEAHGRTWQMLNCMQQSIQHVIYFLTGPKPVFVSTGKS